MTKQTEEKYTSKSYKHIDFPVKYSKVEDYVTNRAKISKHSFLPFIKYTAITEKMIDKPNPDVNNRPIKIKERPLMYAGHLDSFIYKYYSDILNKIYNQYVEDLGISMCAIAYRSYQDKENKKSNIHSAAEVINFIKEQKETVILIGDFTRYFEKIDHRILKENLYEVMDVVSLPNDWFNIYKSVTKYGYYKIEDFEKPNKEVQHFFELKRHTYFKSLKHFRKYKKINSCSYNHLSEGIPQGASISAVLSNVYAINFDKIMHEISLKYNSLYRRYSDDFILVIPDADVTFEINRLMKEINDQAEKNKIIINEDKSSILYYKDGVIIDFMNNRPSKLDYLGFLFDGMEVKMRIKSPNKFYRKAKK